MTPAEHVDAARLHDALEAPLAAGGPYLFGALSLADLALVPTVVRLTARVPDLSRWPRVQAWSATLIARPSVREWMDEAARLPPIVLPEDLPEA